MHQNSSRSTNHLYQQKEQDQEPDDHLQLQSSGTRSSNLLHYYLNLNRLKFWKKHASSLTITEVEQTHKVTYLGNVLTPWAKGDQSVNRALDTLWANYVNKRGGASAEIVMRLTVANWGLQAETKQFGLTEYWANRITYTVCKPNHPRLLCWVYRHVGRRGKPELRCHAVLCAKEEVAKRMARVLGERVASALAEFRREKALRQRARLSLTEMPIRKQLLVKGLANFRPPLERSRSAPKLMAIIEDAEREEEEAEELESEDLLLLRRMRILKEVIAEEEGDVDEDELLDFVESSSISLDGEEEDQSCTSSSLKDYEDDDENDSAIDSESFKSDEIVYSTNG